MDPARLEDISAKLQRRLWNETGGELQFSMAWAKTPEQARRELERRKRSAGLAMLQEGGEWKLGELSRPPLGEPCQICSNARGKEPVYNDEDDEREGVLHCEGCLSARELGRILTQPSWTWIRPREQRDSQTGALGVHFAPTTERQPDAFHAARWIPRNGREDPLTFEDIANKSRGVKRLAVIKADVDDMGVRVGQIVRDDPSLNGLKTFNRDLDKFFGQTMHDYLRDEWPDIYTIYSGGDDLLMAGPWNTVLDFAGQLRKKFQAGPGREYNLTFSAGIALTPYRVPIRHAVHRADQLEAIAKDPKKGKNRCAALDADWPWDNHDSVIGNAKKLANWIENEESNLPRSLIHRLLLIAETNDPTGKALRSAHWTYQIQRNAAQRQLREFQDWAINRADWLSPDAGRDQDVNELTASLKYAMLSTRTAS